MTLRPHYIKTKTIIFKKGVAKKKSEKIYIKNENTTAIKEVSKLKKPLQNINDDYDNCPIQEYQSGRKSIFFGFPFIWIWKNIIGGVRFQANNIYASSQIHVIQDFDIISGIENNILVRTKIWTCRPD